MTVLITDNDPIYRRGLKSLVSEKTYNCIEIEGLAGLSAWCAANTNVSAILLVDGHLALEIAGATAGKMDLGSVRPAALLSRSNMAFADVLLKKGFFGLVMKGDIRDIGVCVDHLAEGKRYAGSVILHSMAGIREKPLFTGSVGDDLLSDKEKSILRFIYQEFSAKQIADKLSLSTRTVEWYRKKMMEKTNSKNMIGLIRFGIEQKILYTQNP